MSFKLRLSKEEAKWCKERRTGWSSDVWNDNECPHYDVFGDTSLKKWRRRPKVRIIHHQTGSLREQRRKAQEEQLDYVEDLLVNPRGQSACNLRQVLHEHRRTPISPALDLVDLPAVPLKQAVECAQIGCYQKAVTLCSVCGFLCRKCDAFFHRSGSRIAARQTHRRRPLQQPTQEFAWNDERSSPSKRSASEPLLGAQAAGSHGRRATASNGSPVGDLPAESDAMPPHVKAAIKELRSSSAIGDLKARRVQGQYVLPYCKILRKEMLHRQVEEWQNRQNFVLSALGGLGVATPSASKTQPLAPQDGAETVSETSDRDGSELQVLPGLEDAVPIRLNTPQQDPNTAEEPMVWFPRAPDPEMQLDAGQTQLLNEGKENEGEESEQQVPSMPDEIWTASDHWADNTVPDDLTEHERELKLQHQTAQRASDTMVQGSTRRRSQVHEFVGLPDEERHLSSYVCNQPSDDQFNVGLIHHAME